MDLSLYVHVKLGAKLENDDLNSLQLRSAR